MPTLCQGGSRKIINELVHMLMLTLGLCGAHVGDGKGSFNCDGEDGGGDNEDREDDDSDEDYDKKNTGKREQAITLVQLRSSRPSSTP